MSKNEIEKIKVINWEGEKIMRFAILWNCVDL